jgi:N-acetylneuraminic acid mutarotase
MHGGSIGEEYNFPQTWAYDYNTNSWQQMADGPEFHLGAQLAYDSESDRVILFSGYQVITGRFFNDTWAYDFNTDTWTEMTPHGSPTGRNFGGMAYDSESDRIILFGGYTSNADTSVWAYDYNSDSWEHMPLEPGSTPGFLDWVKMTYDEKADRVILYGGLSEKGETQDKTWAYDYNTNSWTELKPAVNPGPLIEFAITYDSAADLVVMFGGQINDLFDKLSNQVWTYDYDTNTWTDVTPK